jgi:16S rRNA U516 pseudouridylate synthase RsuA-like enzyme
MEAAAAASSESPTGAPTTGHPDGLQSSPQRCRNRYRSFLIHKPVNVLSSRTDAAVTNTVRDPADPNYGQRIGGQPRRTVYDIAEERGFPVNAGLVGRLDYETSGIMLFTDDPRLGAAVRDPVDKSSALYGSEYKSKEYFLQINPTKSFFDIGTFDPEALEAELSAQLSFARFGVEHTTEKATVTVLRTWRSEEHSFGRPNLGWIIDLKVVIHEGKHHQIRRLASRSAYRVISLCRTRISKILSIESVPSPGDCRWLSEQEVYELCEALLQCDD